jgi:hypothetical protein
MLGEATDQSPRLAVNVVLKVRQRFLAAFALGSLFEQKDGQRTKQAKMVRCGGVPYRAAVFVLGTIPPIVLPIFDAPVAASHFLQSFWTRLLGPIGGEGKAGVVGFFNHLALAHPLSVAMEAHDLSHSGQTHGFGVGRDTP